MTTTARPAYPAQLSPTALKRATAEANAYLEQEKARWPDINHEEVQTAFAKETLERQQRNHQNAIRKRKQTMSDRRLHRALGLSVPAELGNWYLAIPGAYSNPKLPKKGYFGLTVPAMLPAEIDRLQHDLRAAFNSTVNSCVNTQGTEVLKVQPEGFCIDPRGGYYSQNNIVISDTLVRRMIRTGNTANLQSVLTPYLTKVAERMQTMDGLARKMDELTGYPAWTPDYKDTASGKAGSVTLRFDLQAAPNHCEAWSPEGAGQLAPSLKKMAMSMFVYSPHNSVVQELKLSAHNETEMKATVDALAQPPLYNDLRESFHRIALLTFAKYAIKAKPLTQEDRDLWQQCREKTGNPDTLQQMLTHPELPENGRKFIYRHLPATKPPTAA